MSFSTLNQILNKNFKQKKGLTKQVQAALVCDEFKKIIINLWGPKATQKVKALSYQQNILTVACISSALAQEIRLQEKEILQKINQKFNLKIEKINYLV